MKRALDVVVAGTLLVLLTPLLALVALLVWFKLGRPILFRQQRPGYLGGPFELVKFRTMTGQRDADGNLLPVEERLTRFGQGLRTTSLDELPELWNVFRGDMSLVGPRPLLMEYLPLYNARQARRHDVKPGITGWAQINGRNSISWEDKFELDVWYVDHQSFSLDLKILAVTIVKVLQREDIDHELPADLARFTGTPPERRPVGAVTSSRAPAAADR